MKKGYTVCFILILLMISILSANNVFASSFPPAPPAPDVVPIDGGVSLLIGAGVALGVKTLRDKNKKKTKE